MKKLFKVAVSVLLSALLCAAAIPVALSAGAALPDLPKNGIYTLKSSALQLTSGIWEDTTAAAAVGVRIAPGLKESSFDISQYDYIYLWIYISDASLLSNNNGDGIELCSGGQQDSEESALYFYRTKEGVPTINTNYSPLKTGWNEYMLKLDDFTVTKGGSLNSSNLNFIGLVLRSTKAGLTFGMSPVYAVKSGDFTSSAGSSPSTSTGTSSADAGNSEGKAAFGVPLHDFAESAASLSDGTLSLSASTPSSGVGRFAYICAEIYLENSGSLARTGSFFISSSVEAGKQELSGKLSKTDLKEGWNTVFLKIADFRMSGYDYDDPSYDGVCDLMNIRRLGITWDLLSEKKASIKLGKITCTNSGTVPSTPEGKYKISSSAISVTSEEISVSVKANGEKELAQLIPAVTNGSVDITSKKYLYFWIYVSDTSLDGSDTTESFELSSSGTQDINENGIRLSAKGSSEKTLFGDFGKLKDGWNEYLIPIEALSEVTNKTGSASVGCDFTAVNFVRLYFRTAINTNGQSVTYKLSSIYAVNDEDLNGDEGLSLVSSDTSPSSQTGNDDGVDGTDGGPGVILYIAIAAAVVVVATVLFIMLKKKKTAPADKEADSDTNRSK